MAFSFLHPYDFEENFFLDIHCQTERKRIKYLQEIYFFQFEKGDRFP